MPVTIPNDLPATAALKQENIFVMTEQRAYAQDIRPLRIAILNLMPNKEVTETQLLRLIGNTPIQVNITLLHMASHTSKNTSAEHLSAFYQTFESIRGEQFDGLIITGAPVEQMDFPEVTYWEELKTILDWAQDHVFSTLYICWAAQAGLYYHYGVPKYPLSSKRSGVYQHRVLVQGVPLLRGFDDAFYAPHSRHTEVRAEDIAAVDDLELLCVSEQAGVYLAASRDGRRVFVTGHSEYDALTLDQEYKRDIGRGMDVPVPCHYYPGDDPTQAPVVTWRAHANLLFCNWLNYYVYQETPYDLRDLAAGSAGRV